MISSGDVRIPAAAMREEPFDVISAEIQKDGVTTEFILGASPTQKE